MSTSEPVKRRRKLIEVALPLDFINAASSREKSIRHGHPSTLHLWWSRKPLATARAVLFAQLVDDPSSVPEVFQSQDAQDTERLRLFKIIEQLVLWESTTDGVILEQARVEIRNAWKRTCADNAGHPRAAEVFDPDRLPEFYDPFAGGGSLPLEAQRLGLKAFASDLNPVAVLINKAMIEVPPRFAGGPPISAIFSDRKPLYDHAWVGSKGLAEDIIFYGTWMLTEAHKRIGHLYPAIEISPQMARTRPDLKRYIGCKLNVIAWLWARTVNSPDPAFGKLKVPLVASFVLSKRHGKEAYIEPGSDQGQYKFTVRLGKAPKQMDDGTKASQGAFKCLLSNAAFQYGYVDEEANAGRMGTKLLAVVAEGIRGRVYLDASAEMELVAGTAVPSFKPDAPSRGTWASNAQGRIYGFRTFGDYFTSRQLLALDTFSDLVRELRPRVEVDAINAGLADDHETLESGGIGAAAYADAVVLYLGLAVSRASQAWSSLVTWNSHADAIRNTFARQGLVMTWGFAEANPFSSSSGNWIDNVELLRESLLYLPINAPAGVAEQADATTQHVTTGKIVSVDPPYYDNIGYADLSDFFYVWLRRALRPVFPDLFKTVGVPKIEELFASPYRYDGSKSRADAAFLKGMEGALRRLADASHPAFPLTIYYAFKQSETEIDAGTVSTGWETFLEALIRAGLALDSTWPLRTERKGRVNSNETNALASSILLACRSRDPSAPVATRRDFAAALRKELPEALRVLQTSNIAPVDLAQAAIGPGMAIYTRYSKVVDAEGGRVSVRDALALINRSLDEVLTEQEGDFDAGSRWAVAWFEQNGFAEGEYGVAEILSKAKNTSIEHLADAKILESKRGKVRLLKPEELSADWDPIGQSQMTTWEVVHYVIRAVATGGEEAAGELVAKLGAKAEIARELAYRLYTIAERKKRSDEALAYNELILSWPEILRLARDGAGRAAQTHLFEAARG